MSNHIAVIVQARTSSSRLPGKVLAPLAGEPALARMMERVARVRGADWISVATSSHASDDAIEQLCRDRTIACVRGSLDDVLGRFVAAMPTGCDAVVRLTGDCPLVDPELVDQHIALYQQHYTSVQYVSNAVVRTYPDGLDVEVVSASLLREAAVHAQTVADREHVTPWIQRRARQQSVGQDVDLSALRWTLDTPADYEVLSQIYEHLYPSAPEFGRNDVYRLLLAQPSLIHVAGSHPLEAAERAQWQARIESHLATEASQ